MDKSNKYLNKAVYALFYIGLAGQAAFAIYIFGHLGLSAFNQDWEVWTKGMANGIIEGDRMGNTALILHIFLAFIITVGGPLQFIPALRSKQRTFHKWNGRIYIVSVLLTSIFALYLVWARPIVIGGVVGNIAITGNALLIILFGSMTWRTGIQRRFAVHRKWAIRTFIVVLGVWFFRIGFGTWFLVTGFKAPGVSQDLTGWFDSTLYFASYIGPLLVAELYMRIKDSENAKSKIRFTIFLILLCPLLIGGTLITAKVFWMG